MKSLRKYLAIAETTARSNLAYIGEVASRFVFLAVILYIFQRLWQVTYSQTGASQLGGYTLKEMVWYLTIAESIMMSAPRVAQLVDEDVRTGALAVQLVRPLSYPLYRLWSCLGERAVRYVSTLAVGAIISYLLVGPLDVSAGGLVLFALALPLAFVLDFLGNFAIGLFAFWLEDTSGLLLIYSRLTMILGGMLIPVQLFPEALQPMLFALPFVDVVYGPSRLFVHPSVDGFVHLLAHQTAYVVAASLLVAFIYKAALKRVFANGG